MWALLPASTRTQVWPATYRFGNGEAFDILVVPPKRGPDNPPFVTEEKAGDYPEGRYELALQVAVEAGNQADLTALLSRRSRSHAFALTLALIFAILSLLLVPTALNLLSPEAPKATPPALDLPAVDQYPATAPAERQELAARLQQLGHRLHKPLPEGDSPEELTTTLAALDAALGTPDPDHNPGKLSDQGPIKRQLGALLWKHDVTAYNQPGMRTTEMLDHLENKLFAAEKPK